LPVVRRAPRRDRAPARRGSGPLGGGCRPIEDDALLDEVTALVERPNVLVCEFETQFLDVPQECLILTMKANQKYFPLLDAAGKLTNRFLVVSNISPPTPARSSAATSGWCARAWPTPNSSSTRTARRPWRPRRRLSKVVYHNKLGTQGERMERVRAIARAIATQLGRCSLVTERRPAALLAKTDLLTDMVGEFPELQGIMGGYYARHDGLGDAVAFAIEDHYKPRFAGDACRAPRPAWWWHWPTSSRPWSGLFGIGNLPTGDKDPFALRRHALGVIRMLVERAIAAGPGAAAGEQRCRRSVPCIADARVAAVRSSSTTG
jgi:glycyl-tRNA synthetase beta chain